MQRFTAVFRHMKLRTKLLGGFLTVVVLMVAVGLVGRSGMKTENNASRALFERGATPIVTLYALNGDLDGERIRAYRHGMANDPKRLKQYETEIGEKQQAVDEDLAAYEQLFPNGMDATRGKLLDEFKAKLAEYRDVIHTKFIPASRAKTPQLAALTENVVSPGGKAAGDVLDEMSQLEIKQAASLQRHSDEAFSSASTRLWLLLGLGVLVAVGVALSISTSIARAARRLVSAADQLAEGDLTVDVRSDATDELGHVANRLHEAMDRTRTAIGSIAVSAQTLSASAEELNSISRDVGDSADLTAEQAQSASAAAEQVSANIGTVASGAEEMTSSIQEISAHASEASTIAANAVREADETNTTIAELGEASNQIGDVVRTITSIAEQTNLLALNATIEAARAGEMGKGFAVVANEVKELAQQTAQATADVGARITAIQSNTAAAVEAIGRIGGTIGHINDATATIAAAVEEQSATTNEIGRAVHEAATGSTDIARNVTGLADGAQQTNNAVAQTQAAAGDVAQMASELERLVAQFRY